MPEVRIALVTTQPRPEINMDRDMPMLLASLNKEGAEASSVNWDNEEVEWEAFDLVVLRSTWDYTWRSVDFLDWVDSCSHVTNLRNPPSVVRWSSDKHYLARLADAGVPVVATTYAAPNTEPALPSQHAFVVKPAVGAGARYAARYQPSDQATALSHIHRMHSEGLTAMVQPYMSRIDSSGERALVFFDGKFLHAIRKNAVLAPGVPYDQRKVAHPGLEPWVPTQSELDVARSALAVVPDAQDLFYARVDLVDDDAGRPTVMELELVEPNLFLAVQPDSLPVVSRAIVEKARQVRRTRKHQVVEPI
ncbi:RimK family alpha-L-glutamate ligase [Streptomyces sp. NPDC085937]|uniref:RimK family alpha-L-glutamate ligase n=1 Tax=Streptomyces sp. NPDC085937 TaxID=3365742 RepID=UPI0037D90719